MLSYVSLKNKAAGIALLVCAALLTQVAFATQQSNAAPWPQSHSDLKPDSALKFGVLPNGMRYIIMHNNTPTNEVSLRLRFATGSIEETDAQQGIAHLLEHMAFRGSKHVADGDVIKILERIGLKFGADTNAFTSFAETAYKFDLPNATEANVDTGLMLMREIASELNITDESLKTERGVVLSELRLRNTPEYRAEIDQLTALMPGMRPIMRLPIGKQDIIEHVTAQTIRDYYEAHYHPERATLIVVGDVDLDKMAKKIALKFGNWTPAKKSAANPDLGKLEPVEHATRIYVEPTLPTSISISWANPYVRKPSTRETETKDLIRDVGLQVLNLRFQQAALADNAAFTNAQADYEDNVIRAITNAEISISTTPEKWQAGLQSAQHIVNNVLHDGVRQDEVDRVIAMLRTQLQTAVAGSNTRRTQTLADALVNSLENDEVFLSPQQNLDMADAVFKNLKAETVTTALRNTFKGTNSLVDLTSSKPIEGGDATLSSVYKQAVNDTSKEAEAKTVTSWPYAHFGESGKVVQQKKLDDIDTTFVKFSNGVLLAVKHTDFSKGKIDVTVRAGDGRLALNKTGNNPSFMLNTLVSGGLDKIDFPTMQQVLAGKIYGVDPDISDGSILLHGATTPADLGTQLQVLTAYVTAPALRNGAVEQMRNMWLDYIPYVQAQPLQNMSVQSAGLLHSGDARWLWPSLEQVKAINRDEIKSWLDPQLEQGSLQVAIVGDVDVQKAIDATAATLGALLERPAVTLKESPLNETKFPAANAEPLVLHHKGNKDQAQAMIAWPAPDSRSSPTEAADLHMLTSIMQARLIDAMRSKTGSSYTARVVYDGSWKFTGYGNIQATSDTKPEQLQVFFDAVNEIVTSLRKDAVSADEFERSQRPMLAGIDKQKQRNDFWSYVLYSPDVDPAYSGWIRKQADYIKAVTPQRVHAAAEKYLLADKAWKAVMVPQAGGVEAAK